MKRGITAVLGVVVVVCVGVLTVFFYNNNTANNVKGAEVNDVAGEKLYMEKSYL